MIESDNHVHTYFSTDSEASMESMVQAAQNMGFSSLCFTDHMDYDFPTETGELEFIFEPEPYFEEISALRQKYSGISLRAGVELGLKLGVLEKAQNLTQSYPFDFVIGSTHLIDDMDPYYPSYWESYGEERGILRYYEVTLENLSFGFDFDVYGHLDYILRYCPTVKKAMEKKQDLESFYRRVLSVHEELLREILSSLIQKGKGLEVNTAGFKCGLGHPNPHETLISCYKELGGEILSIGSDAHAPEHLGFAFQNIPTLLSQIGFSSYTEFHQRKPVFRNLSTCSFSRSTRN